MTPAQFAYESLEFARNNYGELMWQAWLDENEVIIRAETRQDHRVYSGWIFRHTIELARCPDELVRERVNWIASQIDSNGAKE